MRKFKVRKKELVVMDRDELNSLLYDLSWRLGAADTAFDIAENLIDKEAIRFEREYMRDKIKECRNIIEKFEESL